jgi:hypothetical protein
VTRKKDEDSHSYAQQEEGGVTSLRQDSTILLQKKIHNTYWKSSLEMRPLRWNAQAQMITITTAAM